MSNDYTHNSVAQNNSYHHSSQSPHSQRSAQFTDSAPYQQERYHSPVPQRPYDPLTSTQDSRMSTNTAVYQPAAPMQSHRTASLDYSQPPMSPLPPYIARPPPTVQPPQYYQEIHREIHDGNRPNNYDNFGAFSHEQNNGWTPGRRERTTLDEDEMYQRAGRRNNQSQTINTWELGEDKKTKNRRECRSFLKDLSEFCPCFCLCCFAAINMSVTIRNFEKNDQIAVRNLILEGLAERWGAEFDPSYNQDVTDIDSYYINYHHATVVVLELEENSGYDGTRVIGCGILLPLPAEDVYGTWAAETVLSKHATDLTRELKLCRMMRLSVSRQYRGKGYAKSIIQHLVNSAREKQFDRILVETEIAWTSAVQIYKSLGFKVVDVGEETVHFEYDL
ncbi:hypothetical protein BGZ76_008986 [Entomortierella beljakovae]|nr:hypothetical protein BGZ76_008986 [Entomortierella beljakovae]